MREYDKLLKRVARGGRKARGAVRRLNAMRQLKMAMRQWRGVAAGVEVIEARLARWDEAADGLSFSLAALRDALGGYFRKDASRRPPSP